jgi:hypothetical protein
MVTCRRDKSTPFEFVSPFDRLAQSPAPHYLVATIGDFLVNFAQTATAKSHCLMEGAGALKQKSTVIPYICHFQTLFSQLALDKHSRYASAGYITGAILL